MWNASLRKCDSPKNEREDRKIEMLECELAMKMEKLRAETEREHLNVDNA